MFFLRVQCEWLPFPKTYPIESFGELLCSALFKGPVIMSLGMLASLKPSKSLGMLASLKSLDKGWKLGKLFIFLHTVYVIEKGMHV